MTEAQIQDFLNSKVPTCDTSGSGSYTYRYNSATGRVNFDGSSTEAADPYVTTSRAVYGDRVANYSGDWRGSRAPYTCLKQKTFNTVDIAPESGICNGYVGASNETAARIIYKVAQSCEINPQTLLILLQKEQSLVTDSWPWGIQYDKATGAFCPDSPPAAWAPKNCNPDYLGFPKQVYYGAQRFKVYKANPYNYNYVAGRTNSILWNPNTACGRSDVFIENQATAALYIYTPYRPNSAALNNLYGDGDSCSSYGNRNFWRMWNDWFGSTYAATNLVSDLSISHDSLGKMYTGERTVSFTVRNNTNQSVDLGQIGVASRSPSGRTDGFVMKSVVLGAYQSYTYTDTQSHFTEEGDYHFWIVTLKNGVYYSDLPSSFSSSLVREWWVYIQAAPTVTSDVIPTQSRPTQNANMGLYYTIHNNSSRQVNLGDMGLALFYEDGSNIGMPMSTNVTIPANSDITINSTRWLPKMGKYTAFIVNTKDGGKTWDQSFPSSSNSNIQRKISFTAKSPVSIQGTPTSTPLNPSVGQDVAYTFKIKNYTSVDYVDGQIGLAVRDPDNVNVGYDMQQFVVPANSELTYNVPTKRFTKQGQYTAWIVRYEGGVWTNYDVVEDGTVLSRFTFNVSPNMNLTESPSLTVPSIHANQLVGGVIKIRNTASTQVNDNIVGLAVRDPSNSNVGYDMQPLSIAAGGTYTYNAPARLFGRPGQYNAWVVQYDGKKYSTYSRIDTGVSPSVTFTVKPDATLQATPTISPATPKVGQSVAPSFTIKNYSQFEAVDYPVGLVVIDPNGKNVGYAMQEVKIPVGGTFTYNVPSQAFNVPGVYTAWIVQNIKGYWALYNKTEDSSISTKIQFTVSN